MEVPGERRGKIRAGWLYGIRTVNFGVYTPLLSLDFRSILPPESQTCMAAQ